MTEAPANSWDRESSSLVMVDYTWPLLSQHCVLVLCWYTNGVYLSAIWENVALVQWITLLIGLMCWIFQYRTKSEQRLCFFTRSIHIWHNFYKYNYCTSNYSTSVIWVDTDIRHMVEITVKSVRILEYWIVDSLGLVEKLIWQGHMVNW